MVDNILQLVGMSLDEYHISDDLLFAVSSVLVLYALTFVLSLFKTLIERLTARK